MKKAPTFLLVGNGPYANRGCEAIVRGTVEILSQCWPEARYFLSSFGVDDTNHDAINESDARITHRPHEYYWYHRFDSDWWQYRVFHRYSKLWQYGASFRSQFQAALKSDIILQIGGDNYSLEYGYPAQYVELDRVLLSTGKPLVLWGASIGSAHNNETDRLLGEHLQKFDLILARETETYAFLQSLGLNDKLQLVADPAFLLRPEPIELSPELQSVLNSHPIGINFSTHAGTFSRISQDKWHQIASECITSIASLGVPILLVPHVTVPEGDDYKFLKIAMEHARCSTNNVHLLPGTLTAAQYKYIISQLRVFIAARAHAVIAALSSSVPTILIGYSAKSEGINYDIYGTHDWLIHGENLTPVELSSKLNNILREEVRLRQEIGVKIPTMVNRACKATEYIAQLM